MATQSGTSRRTPDAVTGSPTPRVDALRKVFEEEGVVITPAIWFLAGELERELITLTEEHRPLTDDELRKSGY